MFEDDNHDTLLIEKKKREIIDSLDSIINLLVDDTQPQYTEIDLEFIESIRYNVDEIKRMWE